MQRPIILASVTLLLVGAATIVVAAGAPNAAAKPIPSLSELRQGVLRYFQAQPDYQPGDLITRDKVEPLLLQLQRKGLPLPNAKQILEKVPAKDDFLAKQLRTPDGRTLMRDISGCAGAYDRLDQLCRQAHGQQTIGNLIHGVSGLKVIEYVVTEPDGKALGERLSELLQGGDFNAKTGRIYTAEMLLRRLEQARADALKPAKKQPAVVKTENGRLGS
jgi:hypothetical protein